MAQEQWPRQQLSGASWQRGTYKTGLRASFLALLMYLSPAAYGHPTIAVPALRDPVAYHGEHIKWHQCDETDEDGFECSKIDVPMDQFDEENSGNKTFSIPLVRIRGSKATKNLLLNPGGPSVSGVDFVLENGQDILDIIGEGYHLVGFDPRGVAGSRPLAQCFPDDATREEKSRGYEFADVIEDSGEFFAQATNYGRACNDTAGEFGKYINTPQTAADMNSILDALGQENLFYWGFSYGTTLGQTYADLFPERSERIIIDGVSDQKQWYGVRNSTDYLRDAESVLHGFFDECFKAQDRCALVNRAGSADELQKIFLEMINALDEQPLSEYKDNTNYDILSHNRLINFLFRQLYDPSEWSIGAEILLGYLTKDEASAAASLALAKTATNTGDESLDFVKMNDAQSGPRFWPHGRLSLLDQLSTVLNSSIFGLAAALDFYNSQQWPIPRTHGFVPSERVRTLHPLLVMSSTYDPVCPLKAARSARDTFEDSRLVEVLGYGHCADVQPSMCAAGYIRGYLSEGTLPLEDVQCEPDGGYFVSEEEEAMWLNERAFSAAEMRIHEAQVSLAKALGRLPKRL